MVDYINQIIAGDALTVMRDMPSDCISFILTAPPHFSPNSVSGKENCAHDFDIPSLTDGQATSSLFCVKCGAPRHPLGFEGDVREYVHSLCARFGEAFRLLKEDGICCVVLGDTRRAAGSMFGIPFRFAREMLNRTWVLKDVFMLQRGANSDLDHVFIFTKSDIAMGKWRQSPLKVFHGQTIVKGFGYGAFPPNLVARLLEIYCPRDGVVLDCFAGSCMVGLVSKQSGRNWVAIEINKNYCQIGTERIKKGIL